MTFDFLLIAAFGSGALIFGTGTLALLLAWLPTRRWRPVPARIEAFEVTPKAGKYVSMDPEVKARYRYEYDGVRYEGSRISVLEVRPRLFSGYDPTTLRLLDEAMIVEETVTIRLDPRHPARSVLLDPPVKTHLTVGALFALVCGVVLVFAVRSDTSPVSIAVGSGLAGLAFLIALLFRDGTWVLMIFSNV